MRDKRLGYLEEKRRNKGRKEVGGGEGGNSLNR